MSPSTRPVAIRRVAASRPPDRVMSTGPVATRRVTVRGLRGRRRRLLARPGARTEAALCSSGTATRLYEMDGWIQADGRVHEWKGGRAGWRVDGDKLKGTENAGMPKMAC